MLNQVDLSRVDLNLLVLFDTVREVRHVGRAADRLHLTSSAVSHGLSRLRRLLNDPLFLRTPKGVVPTERALQLAGPIADVLAQARSVLASAEPFDPARSTRRFTIGAPDGISAVLLIQLMGELRGLAPGIDIGVRQLLQAPGETSLPRAWRSAFTELEARAMDIAVLPFGDVPPRFHAGALYDEDFVIASAAGHPFARNVSLNRFCAMRHVVVSDSATLMASWIRCWQTTTKAAGGPLETPAAKPTFASSALTKLLAGDLAGCCSSHAQNSVVVS